MAELASQSQQATPPLGQSGSGGVVAPWWALLLAGSLAVAAPGVAVPEERGPVQPWLDAAADGAVVRLPAGRWTGPVLITRPVTLDGAGQATIDGQGRGTVITVRAADVTLRGLHVTHSGDGHDAMDAAVLVTADRFRLEGSVVDDALFALRLEGANDAHVCGNRLSTKGGEAGMRGDAVRTWNGRRNRLEGNLVEGARDLSFSNAPDNLVLGNVIRHGRIAAHLTFSPRTRLEGNWMDENLVGITVLYSDDVVVRRNRVQHSFGQSGSCLTFKEASHGVVEDNEFLHCAVGARANSPTHPENVLRFAHNRFAHSFAALDFYGENGGHTLVANRFEKNLVQVSVSASMAARGNTWHGNSWDDYQGFDRDGDGVGDVPHEIYAFADRIWMEEPKATFFRNSPVLELMDFLERLAPFASPELILRDDAPAFRPQDVGPRGGELTRPLVPAPCSDAPG